MLTAINPPTIAPNPAPAKCVMKRRRVSLAADMEPPEDWAPL